nr:hypothetical protein [Tanacetum cinerariifolium]
MDLSDIEKLDDNDAVSLCCVGILQLVLLDVEDRRHVPNWILSDPTNETDTKSYSIEGFAWEFKTWILESFRAATDDYYTRYRRHPRIVAWSSKHKFYRHMLKPMLHGQLPVERLVPDETEARSRWFMEDMRRVPEANRTPIIADQHFGVSDISGFQSYQNLCDRARREPQPSVYMLSPYTVLPPTTVLAKKRIDKKKKKGKTKKLSPLNLGNTFADENVSRDDVTITGVQQTDNYFNYQTVDPDKGYELLSFFWPQLVLHLCTYRRERSWPKGWLSSDHMNLWIQILIRERTENANWTLAKSGTLCLHQENNHFMILTDPHNIGTLDGSVRPFPSWNDVT